MTDLPPLPFCFRIFFRPGNPNNRTLYVVGEVEGQLVMRTWWRKWGGHWHYTIEDPSFIDVYLKSGHGKIVKRRIPKP